MGKDKQLSTKEEIEKLKKSYWWTTPLPMLLQNRGGGQLYFVSGFFKPKMYVVNTDEMELRLRRKLVKLDHWMTFAELLFILTASQFIYSLWWVILLLFIASIIGGDMFIKSFFKDDIALFTPVDMKKTFQNQKVADFMPQYSKGSMVFMLLGSAAFVVGGIYILKTDNSEAFMAWSCIIFFGLCGLVALYKLFEKSDKAIS